MQNSKIIWLHLLKILTILVVAYFLFGGGKNLIIILSVVVINYIYIEAKNFWKENNFTINVPIYNTIDYSLYNFGYSFFMGWMIVALVSMFGPVIFNNKQIGSIIESRDYTANYIIDYKIDNLHSKPRLAVAELWHETNGRDSEYYITKIVDDDFVIRFDQDESCPINTHMEWYRCEDVTFNGKSIYVFITDKMVDWK